MCENLCWGADRGGEDRGGDRGGADEVHSEFGVEKVIKQRIEATAQARQAQRDLVKLFHSQPGGTVGHKVTRHHDVENEIDVVWGEAEQKECSTAQYQPQSSPLLTVPILLLAFMWMTIRHD